MPATAIAPKLKIIELEGEGVFTGDEAAALFEATAQQYLSMSATEFLRKWDANEFRDPQTKSRAMRVAALIPLVRTISARQKTR